jgi:acyl-coenzyme A synthetase/AMP-(fatty) acid ligase
VLNSAYSPNQNTADEIFSFAKKNLAFYKTPRIIEFVTELPKTISGKIRRVELRANEAQKKLQQQKGEYEYYF